MTYSLQIGTAKILFSDTHFKQLRKKPTISVYDADGNTETKIASFNSQETFEWFIKIMLAEQNRRIDCYDCDYWSYDLETCGYGGGCEFRKRQTEREGK